MKLKKEIKAEIRAAFKVDIRVETDIDIVAGVLAQHAISLLESADQYQEWFEPEKEGG